MLLDRYVMDAQYPEGRYCWLALQLDSAALCARMQKSPNILLTADGRAQIADTGMACMFKRAPACMAARGTFAWWGSHRRVCVVPGNASHIAVMPVSQ